MTSYGSGLDAQWGFAEETYWNNQATPTRFLPILSASMKPNVIDLPMPELLGRGGHYRSGESKLVKRGGGGDLEFVVTNKAFGLILKQLGDGVFSWPGSTNASQVLTCTGQPSNNNTVVIGSTTYTYKTTLTASTTANEVLIGATLAESIRNLANAINGGQGEGVWYGSQTPVHPTVSATYDATTLTVTDKAGRGASAADATTETHANATWGGATLTGGVNGTDTAYLVTVTPHARGGRRQSITMQPALSSVSSGIIHPWTYSGCKPVSATLSLSMDDWLRLTMTFDAGNVVTNVALATPTYASGTSLFDFSQAALTLDGVASDLVAFSLELPLPKATDRSYLGNTKREQIQNAKSLPTGSVDAHFTDMTHYAAWLAQTHSELVLTLTGDTISGSASPYLFRVTLPVIEWTGDAPVTNGPDLTLQPRPFRVLDDGTNPPWKIEYRTSDTAF